MSVSYAHYKGVHFPKGDAMLPSQMNLHKQVRYNRLIEDLDSTGYKHSKITVTACGNWVNNFKHYFSPFLVKISE